MVDKLHREILFGLHIKTGCGRRSFRVSSFGNGFNFIFIRRVPLEIQKNHVLRQQDFRRTAVGGILDLYHQGNDGIFFSGFPVYCDDQIIRMKGFRIDMGIHTVIQVCHPFRNGNSGLTGGNGQPHTADITAGGCVRQIIVKHLRDLGQIRFSACPGYHRVFHSGVGGCQNRCPYGISVLHTVIAAFRFGDLVIQILRFIQRCAGFLLCGNGLIELGLQYGIIQIGHPCLMRQSPVVAGRHHAVTIQRFYGIHKRLGLFAQRGCVSGFRCFSGSLCAFLRGGRFCKGKRTAQIAEQQNACQQKCQPPFPEFHKMIRHNCLLYYNCIIGHRSCCLFGFGRVCPSNGSTARPGSGIKPPKQFGTKSESQVPPNTT